MHFSNEILRQLGPEYEYLSPDYKYKPGSWFWASGSHILKKSGRPFSEKRRPVVLATPFGPGATLYPRSASGTSGFRHRPHHHDEGEPPCRINRAGRVVFGVPVTVDSSLLDETSFSCAEPDGTGLLEEIRKKIEARPS